MSADAPVPAWTKQTPTETWSWYSGLEDSRLLAILGDASNEPAITVRPYVYGRVGEKYYGAGVYVTFGDRVLQIQTSPKGKKVRCFVDGNEV